MCMRTVNHQSAPQTQYMVDVLLYSYLYWYLLHCCRAHLCFQKSDAKSTLAEVGLKNDTFDEVVRPSIDR
jgi:hypothetical protein